MKTTSSLAVLVSGALVGAAAISGFGVRPAEAQPAAPAAPARFQVSAYAGPTKDGSATAVTSWTPPPANCGTGSRARNWRRCRTRSGDGPDRRPEGPMVLSDLVTAEIHARFTPTSAAKVAAELARSAIPSLPEPGRWRDRILLGILVVAEGKLGAFRRALRLAETDWRDLLLAATLHTQDWAVVSARAGFRDP